jgi:hypothetical protein
MCSDFPRGPSEDCTMFCPARELVRPYAARAFADSFHRSRRREANGGGCRADSVVPWTHSHTLLPQSHRTTSQSGYFTFTLLFLKLNHFIPGAIFLLSLNSWIVSLSSTHLACRWNVEKMIIFYFLLASPCSMYAYVYILLHHWLYTQTWSFSGLFVAYFPALN